MNLASKILKQTIHSQQTLAGPNYSKVRHKPTTELRCEILYLTVTSAWPCIDTSRWVTFVGAWSQGSNEFKGYPVVKYCTANLNKDTLLLPKISNYFTVDKLPEMTRFGTNKHQLYILLSV